MKYLGLLAFSLTFASFGCGPANDGSIGETDAAVESDAPPDRADASGICDEQDFNIDYVPTSLMLALDMSGSMNNDNKYASARAGIINALNSLQGQFAVGFNSYPRYPFIDNCFIGGTALFDSAMGTESGIISWLNGHQPRWGASDPLIIQLDAILNDPTFAPNFRAAPSGNAYVVVISDGDDCCGPAGTSNCTVEWQAELVAKTEELLQAGIRTIMVGYDGADAATMQAMAAAGGSAFTSYLPAANQTALQNALETIGGEVVSCSFDVTDPDVSADPDNINIYIDDVVLPFDPGCAAGTGWDWTNTAQDAVQLCNTPCEQLRDGTIGALSAKFGCPSVVVD